MDLIGEGHQQTPALPIDTIPGHLFRRLSVICNLLFRKFITVTNMHIFPIHEQYIKYSSVLLAFYDSSMVKYRKVDLPSERAALLYQKPRTNRGFWPGRMKFVNRILLDL